MAEVKNNTCPTLLLVLITCSGLFVPLEAVFCLQPYLFFFTS